MTYSSPFLKRKSDVDRGRDLQGGYHHAPLPISHDFDGEVSTEESGLGYTKLEGYSSQGGTEYFMEKEKSTET
ncbi:hypothetical protein PsorP6_000890 [Peronosclerospora sorghi]|uniref:Uncharacterized protein n=1 Tax=Peronosclerospora sorghi TaxID=230839 RepID=A0ACC0WXJ0_9STRA|nr:hypothetical protein PsorP6_000890 [Peronosclerospora sorghi]